MPTYIIKPSRDEDFYVWWSTVVDAPIWWGPRHYAPLGNDARPERFARADERGTSANWDDCPIEEMPFGWNDDEWSITNQDDLEETGEGWWLLPRKNLREFCRRRDAGEQIADLVRWEADELTDDEREPAVTILCAHHAAVVAATIRAVPHLDPDERDRLADDLDQEKPCP
jgi:hypothetical protein